MIIKNFKIENSFSSHSLRIWKIIQKFFWVFGVFIVFSLIFYPTIGIHLFWNILIPVAPLLMVISVGVWRNICPMASTSLFPKKNGFSKKIKLSKSQLEKLNLIGVIALLILIPLRHAIFDLNGLATAILILSLTLIAFISGLIFDSKSAWCSGLCPIQHVEKLYGLKNKFSLPNTQCNTCSRCVTPCPDITPGINPLSLEKKPYHKVAGILMIGGFPGFVWGWFQVRDYDGIISISQLIDIYKLPLLGLLVTGLLFLVLKNFFKKDFLISLFSAAAVSCYYWFRIPALFGFGIFPQDGVLIDLTGLVSDRFIMGIIISMTIFFFWWIVFSKRNKNSWVAKPVYSNETIQLKNC